MEAPVHQQLKTARDRRGLSLADVSHRTRIPIHALQQLEGGDFAGFGSMTYARSFLKNYAAYLGVEAGPALQHLPKAIFVGTGNYRYLSSHLGTWLRGSSSKDRLSRQSQEMPVPASFKGRTAVMVGVVAVLFGAWGYWVSQSRANQETRAKAEATAPTPRPELSVNEPISLPARSVDSFAQ
jgi:cytoskeletal protein RodZ